MSAPYGRASIVTIPVISRVEEHRRKAARERAARYAPEENPPEPSFSQSSGRHQVDTAPVRLTQGSRRPAASKDKLLRSRSRGELQAQDRKRTTWTGSHFAKRTSQRSFKSRVTLSIALPQQESPV